MSQLVVGGDGTIGRALARSLAADAVPFLSTTRRQGLAGPDRPYLDLGDEPSMWKLPPDVSVVYICAGETQRQVCQSEPERTWAINVVNTLALARHYLDQGATVLLPSSNQVFDGEAAEQPAASDTCPRTEVGRQSVAAERGILAHPGTSAVVRLSKVVESSVPLLSGWVRALRHGIEVTAFSDLVMAPIPVSLVVRVFRAVADKRATGVFQLSGDRDVAFSDVAAWLAHRIGAPASLVRAVPSAEAGVSLESVPRHTTMDGTRTLDELGFERPHVWHVLRAIDWARTGAEQAVMEGDR